MEARGDPVEPGQQLVVEVEAAVGKDVDLGRLQHRDVVVAAFCRDLLPLAEHPLGIEPAGHGQALGVVADREVPVAARARGLDHGGDVSVPSLQVVCDVQLAAQVSRVTSAGSGPAGAASISPASSRSSGGIGCRPRAA